VVAAFEQLIDEGYFESRPGAGTFVACAVADPPPVAHTEPLRGSASHSTPIVRPFRFYEPSLRSIPAEIWARIASRRIRKASERQLGSGPAFGYLPLREALADYLRRSRGVFCRAEQVMITGGTNQILDLLFRLIMKTGDAVCVEDPGYPGAVAAIRSAGGRVVPVAVDDAGFNPDAAQRRAPDARAAYITPAHQFPLGMTMPLERR